MTATNKEIIEQAYASFAAGDVPAALAAFADDIQWTEPDGYPIAGTFVGPQKVLEGVFMRLGEIGDHFSVVPEHYVAAGDTHLAELRHEPLVALTPGGDGLDALRAIAEGAPHHLFTGGWLVVEHGFDQGAATRRLLAEAGLVDVETRRDLAGLERATAGRLASAA